MRAGRRQSAGGDFRERDIPLCSVERMATLLGGVKGDFVWRGEILRSVRRSEQRLCAAELLDGTNDAEAHGVVLRCGKEASGAAGIQNLAV